MTRKQSNLRIRDRKHKHPLPHQLRMKAVHSTSSKRCLSFLPPYRNMDEKMHSPDVVEVDPVMVTGTKTAGMEDRKIDQRASNPYRAASRGCW